MKIGIVGPCGAGKTTLQNNLIRLGYDAHAIAQEHSGMQAMWQRVTKPDTLIFLDASLATICARLKVNWEQSYIDEQQRRLTHARAHADFFLNTDLLTREQVAERVVEFVKSKLG
jgi:deoxyadenosine/deoxycytidine kinase